MLQRFDRANLQLQPGKCVFAQPHKRSFKSRSAQSTPKKSLSKGKSTERNEENSDIIHEIINQDLAQSVGTLNPLRNIRIESIAHSIKKDLGRNPQRRPGVSLIDRGRLIRIEQTKNKPAEQIALEEATDQRGESFVSDLQPKVEYLGYVVSQDGVSASPEKVRAVQNYPVPKTVREVRSFIGLASFYRRLIPNFAEISKPLTELLRKETSFKWEGKQQAAFEKLKEALCSSQVLAYPDFSAQFILTTDGSRTAVAAFLSQVQNGVERPISYASRQLNRAEGNYGASELELLAVTWAMKHYRCYIFGRQIVVRTDHSALQTLVSLPDCTTSLL